MQSGLFSFLNTPVFGDSSGSITIWNIVVVTVLMTLVFFTLRRFRRFVVRKLSERIGTRAATVHSLMLIFNYCVGIVIFLALIQASGVNLHALTVVFGALSVGIGFGLQNVVNNFVCGIVMLFERPVRMGDRVLIDGQEGDVVDIALRATTIRTNEGVSVVVPNSHFITATVVNRSLDEHRIRIKIPINVAYGTDPEHVRNTLLSVASEHAGVLKDPGPTVIFDEYGRNGLHFFLWVWTEEYSHRPAIFRSELNFMLSSALKKAQIQIPYPQVDIHVRSMPS